MLNCACEDLVYKKQLCLGDEAKLPIRLNLTLFLQPCGLNWGVPVGCNPNWHDRIIETNHGPSFAVANATNISFFPYDSLVQKIAYQLSPLLADINHGWFPMWFGWFPFWALAKRQTKQLLFARARSEGTQGGDSTTARSCRQSGMKPPVVMPVRCAFKWSKLLNLQRCFGILYGEVRLIVVKYGDNKQQ